MRASTPVPTGTESAYRSATPASHALLLLGVVLWSTNFTSVKAGLEHGFSPLVFNSVRWVIASALVCAVALSVERSLRVARSDLAMIIAAGGGLFAVNQIFAVFALEYGSATMTAIIFGLVPIFVAVIARVVRLERLNRRYWVGAAVSFVGVGALALGAEKISGDVAGAALALVNVGSFAAYIVLTAPLIGRYSVLRVSALTLASATVILVAAGGIQIAREPWESVDTTAWASLFYATASVVIANVVWLEGARRVGPSRASVYSNLLPLFGAIVAAVVLHERLAALQIVGGAIVLIGIAVASLRGTGLRPAGSTPVRDATELPPGDPEPTAG